MLSRKRVILAVLVLTITALATVPAVSGASGTGNGNDKIVNCDVEDLTVDKSTKTDGSAIWFGIHCTGQKTLQLEVSVKLGDKLLFLLEDTDSVTGNVSLHKHIHLPVELPLDAEVCVVLVDDVISVKECKTVTVGGGLL